MQYDSDNVFAKILRGEIPCHKVYEDDVVLAFLDVMPQARGHTLVVPKAPSRNLLDADPETLAETIKRVQKIARAVVETFDADGFRLAQFNEEAADQTVFHLHLHIVPAYHGQPLRRHASEAVDHEALAADAKLLAAALA